MELRWTDSEDIAIELFEADPARDPLALRFTELRDMVTALTGFEDDPGACSEGKLEAIQMAWLEEYREGQDGR